MSRSGASALDIALALARSPMRAGEARLQPLPTDVELLIRLATGDGESLASATARTGESPAALRESATFYLQQVLFHEQSDSYRVLGVAPEATDAQLKLHHRLLMRWLHPDRSGGAWEGVFVDRVNSAWNDVRNSDRRLDYERRRGHSTPAHSDSGDDLADARTLAMVAATGFSGDAPVRGRRRWVRRVAWTIGALAAGAAMAMLYLQLDALDALNESDDPTLLASDPKTNAEPDLAGLPTLGWPEARRVSEGNIASPVQASASEVVPTSPSGQQEAQDVVESSSPRSADARSSSTLARATPAVVAPALAPSPESFSSALARDESRTVSAPVASTPAMRSPPNPEKALAVANVAPPTRSREVAAAATAPPSTTAFAPTATASFAARQPLRLDERRLAVLLRLFADGYERGDLRAVRALAVTDPDREMLGALRGLEQLFASSDYRRIELDALNWMHAEDHSVAIAKYRAIVLPHGAATGTASTGTIRFDFRAERDQPRIARLSQESE